MRLLRLTLKILKGIYDLVVSYSLAWVLLFALIAWGLQLLATLVVHLLGHSSTELFWAWVDQRSPVASVSLRAVGFGLVHLWLLWSFRRRVRWLQGLAERAADRVLAGYRRWMGGEGAAAKVAGGFFSLGITLLLVPFVVQPTLVPLRFNAQSWWHRSANLLDGSASVALVESVVGLYRKLYAEPVVAGGVTDEEFDLSSAEDPPDHLEGPPTSFRPTSFRPRPLMDRWDELIRESVAGDHRAFALVKAFIKIESAGEQFAVSSTGCAGLMQFCSPTARSGGFRRIFGVGQVYPCKCRGSCRVERPVRKALESGDLQRIMLQEPHFPCDLTDARFDPGKNIRAGWLFIRRLEQRFGGNIYLMYIGYNSGPAVAARLWVALGQHAAATLDQIAPLLPGALQPYYGAGAPGRARSLVRVHLPRLARAFARYSAPATGMGPPPSTSSSEGSF